MAGDALCRQPDCVRLPPDDRLPPAPLPRIVVAEHEQRVAAAADIVQSPVASENLQDESGGCSDPVRRLQGVVIPEDKERTA